MHSDPRQRQPTVLRSGCWRSVLSPYLEQDVDVELSEHGIYIDRSIRLTPSIEANSPYFGHPSWTEEYFRSCHRDEPFRRRWRTAIGSWNDKIC
jgi:hypothetical protein